MFTAYEDGLNITSPENSMEFLFGYWLENLQGYGKRSLAIQLNSNTIGLAGLACGKIPLYGKNAKEGSIRDA